jgi:hypothetical protein
MPAFGFGYLERRMRSIRLKSGFLAAGIVVTLPMLVSSPLAPGVLPLGVQRATEEQHAAQQGWNVDPLPNIVEPCDAETRCPLRVIRDRGLQILAPPNVR